MQKSEQIKAFLRIVLGDDVGYVNISTKDPNSGEWIQKFFDYPNKLDEGIEYVLDNMMHKDVYFCPQVLSGKKVSKDFVKSAGCIWADVDDLEPEKLLIDPTILVQTSSERTQAYWVLEENVDPYEAERIAYAIAQYHKEQGIDTSGWDLTQRLRVVGTYNHKYKPTPVVSLVEYDRDTKFKLDDFNDYTDAITKEGAVRVDFSEVEAPDISHIDPDELLDLNKAKLPPKIFELYNTKPNRDWSSNLWTLELLLLENGFSEEETFAICNNAACNKYARDGRKASGLWAEVQKAQKKVETDHKPNTLVGVSSQMTPILSDEDRKEAAETKDFVEEYIEWAKQQSDAAWQYHQAGAFIVLSTLLSGGVHLPTSFGTIIPNMWFMILADTTLTRKSTAMDMAVDLINEIDPDTILATDGSIEGLLTSLSTRPGYPSLFFRDEVTGLMESVSKKDYYAGMLETLTKLYDGKRQRRRLKKEDIDVENPVFIFFAGGIKSKMLEALNHQHISSGFVPRFVFITAQGDSTKLKPVGPPTTASKEGRNRLLMRGINLLKHYRGSYDGQGRRKKFEAWLDDQSWYLYNQYEFRMMRDVEDSTLRDKLTPVMDRLAKSGLKAAVLLAAAESKAEEYVQVEPRHINRAFYFVEQWREHSVDIVTGSGNTENERNVQNVLSIIKASGEDGTTHPELMRYTKLQPFQMNNIITTLEERELIVRYGSGKKRRYFDSTKVAKEA